MIYELIEDISKRIMEWAIRHQPDRKHIIDEIESKLIYRRTEKVKRALSESVH